jgi:hypothetical protein
MLNIIVWDLFAPYVKALADIDDPLPDLRERVLQILQQCVIALGPAH